MAAGMAFGGVAMVAATAGGLAFAVHEELRRTDISIDFELDSLTMKQRLMDADILDGLTDLSLYAKAVADGPAIIAALRAEHPVGSLVFASGVRRLEDGYAAMRQNYETYNESD
jgi:hypothetical protein